MRPHAPGDGGSQPVEAFRGFVAVLLPEALREAVARVAAPLRGHGDVKWVAPENYHLTLKFLGQVPVALADSDAAVIVTAHPGVDWAAVAEQAPLVVDFRGVTRGVPAGNIVRL